MVIAAVIVGGIGELMYLSHADHRRNISLPSTLLGLHQVTSPQELRCAHNTVHHDTSQGTLDAPVAAIYGDSAGGALAVVVGTPGPNGPRLTLTTRQLVQAARAYGRLDATAFPPGPHGGSLICYSGARKTVGCSWLDQVTAAQVFFNGGYATTLADAAAKTRQLRDAIER